MARTKPLTVTEVENAEPNLKNNKATLKKLFDGDGLHLRVNPNGSKRWMLEFIDPLTKKRNSISLGGYPEISLSRARELRALTQELLKQGTRPNYQKKENKQHTLNAIAASWFNTKKNNITAGYAKDIWGSLERHIFPTLGNVLISELTTPNVISTLRKLESQAKYDSIKRICARLNEIMIFAINSGVISSNPLTNVGKAFRTRIAIHNPSLSPEQLPFLMRKISIANIRFLTRCLIEWQLHTMTRPSEAVSARWEDIDFDNKLWIIPPSVMKTNVIHKIPLTKQTLNLLEILRPEAGCRTYLFPSPYKVEGHMSASSVNSALKRMGFKGQQTSHGLRGLSRTALSEAGFDFEASEACLSHKVGTSVSQAYNHSTYLPQRIKMMKWWSKHIELAATRTNCLSANLRS